MQRKRVGIVLFDDVEVLDFCWPFEVFSVTRLREEKRREEPSPFEVFLIAEKSTPVRVRVAQTSLHDVCDFSKSKFCDRDCQGEPWR